MTTALTPRKFGERGFTLAEVLVATLVILVGLVAVATGFQYATSGVETGRGETVRSTFGYDGAGIGVALIDSGVTPWHDDLQGASGQRVTAFVDFVNDATQAYDDYGHGTHVAGIVAGNGHDSGGSRAGIAPAAHVVSLKVLDGLGRGVISDVIAAIEYSIANRTAVQK